jgi:predicted membrane protein
VCIAGLIYGPPYGLGRHIQAVSREDLNMFLLGDYVFSHFYDVAIASTKLSVLALYHRVFATKKIRILTNTTAAIVVLWLVAMEIVLGIGCRPIEGWWTGIDAQCVNKVNFTYSTNSINLILDLWIFLMPIPIILGLQTSTYKRLSLCFLFSVGLGTCAISAARLSFVVSVGAEDITWSVVPLGILSAWEPCGLILCANLPMTYRSLSSAFRQLRTSYSGSQSATSSGRRRTRDALYHDWIRMEKSGGLRGDRQGLPEVFVEKGSAVAPEDEATDASGIMVKRSFTQDFSH